ncbi:MAG: hypothetical protein MPJ50_08785 [Pirellulales bacterium]|nr:hypothetical protein [Pirellulales bacterium]
MRFSQSRWLALTVLAVVAFLGSTLPGNRNVIAAEAHACAALCPFCNPVALTLSEEMATRDVAVVAELLADPPAPPEANDEVAAKAQFAVHHVLKGADFVSAGENATKFGAYYYGAGKKGDLFLMMTLEGDNEDWNIPIPLNERCAAYVRELPGLPESGADRLAFFQDYFEDEETLLARDAYDEFARAAYEDVIALKDRMQRQKLLAWIADPEIVTSRRRLYLTMLGVCGTKDDAEAIRQFIAEKKDDSSSGLDAAIACYLSLAGADGMPFVEKNFLANHDAPYTQTYSAIMALRFHGTSENRIPLDRVKQGMRLMLDRPQLADLVIPDLARWEDWTITDKLVTLFKDADEETSWVRVPVVQYLLANPDPKMATLISELEKIDSDAVRRAKFFQTFGGGPRTGNTGGGGSNGGSSSAPPPTKSDDGK